MEKGTREHNFAERQNIWTGPVQEKSKGQGSGSCWAETVDNRIRKEIPSLVQYNLAGTGIGKKKYGSVNKDHLKNVIQHLILCSPLF